MRIPRWNHWLRRLTTQNWLRPFRPQPASIVRAAWNHPNRELPETIARLIAPGDRGMCIGGFAAGWLRPLAQRVGPAGRILAVESVANHRAALRVLQSRFAIRQVAIVPSIPSAMPADSQDSSTDSGEWNWLLIGASAMCDCESVRQLLESAGRPAVWWQMSQTAPQLQRIDSEWVQWLEQFGYTVYASTPSGMTRWLPGMDADAIALLTLAHLARLPANAARSLPQLPDSLPRAA